MAAKTPVSGQVLDVRPRFATRWLVVTLTLVVTLATFATKQAVIFIADLAGEDRRPSGAALQPDHRVDAGTAGMVTAATSMARQPSGPV